MVSWFNLSLLGFFLFFIIVGQAKPLLESSKPSEQSKLSKNQQQFYEIYKAMRADPRLESVSNNDIVLYIYQKYANGQKNDIDSLIQKTPNQQQNTE